MKETRNQLMAVLVFALLFAVGAVVLYETGIMVDLDTVYQEKKERYITPYAKWLESQNL